MIVRLSSGGTNERLRLFCFPYSGGSAGSFRPWAGGMPADVGLYSIDMPGRGPLFREPNYASMKDLISAELDGLVRLLDRPFALFGHSLGGRVAFAIAEHLRSRGLPSPRLLVVSGCLPPDRRPRRNVAGMSNEEFLLYLRQLGGTPAEALENAELMDAFSRPLRADFRLAQEILPISGLLDCPLLAVGGTEDGDVAIDDLRQWRAATRGPFWMELFPGNHFYLQPKRQSVIELLLGKLDRLTRGAI